MTPKENSARTLGGFLNRFFNPSNEQVEAAGERVLQRLQEGTLAVAEPLAFLRPRRYAGVVFAAAAVMLVVALSATLWKVNDWRVNEASVIVKSADGKLTLSDGSRIEMRPGADVSVERVADGLRIRLKSGSIIVNAAKQAAGRHLYVETKDVTVSVIGTVFLVKADDKGSHVAVIQGEVHVQQGAVERNLLPGEQASSNATLQDLALQVEIGWSREAAAYLSMLHQSLVEKLAARQASPRTAPVSDKPQFEEASVRPCEKDFKAPEGMRGGGANSLRMSPGRLDALCMTVATLIRTAYRSLDHNSVGPSDEPLFLNTTFGLGEEDGTRVRGGPDWMRLEKFTIAAVAQGPVGAQTLSGPMLLTLLERRFQLQAHVQSEEVPAWSLEIAKSGLKMKPVESGSCFRRPSVIRDETTWLRIEQERGTKTPCGFIPEGAGPVERYVITGESMRDLAGHLTAASWKMGDFGGPLSSTLGGFFVLDKTSIPDTTIFNYVLEYAVDTEVIRTLGLPAGNPSDPRGPTIFQAIEKLGLQLERRKTSREFIVIDHIERPSPN